MPHPEIEEHNAMMKAYDFAMDFYCLCRPLLRLRDQHDFRISCGVMPTNSELIEELYPDPEDSRPACGFNGQSLHDWITSGVIHLTFGTNATGGDEDERFRREAAVGSLVAKTFESLGFTVDWNGNPGRTVEVRRPQPISSSN